MLSSFVTVLIAALCVDQGIAFAPPSVHYMSSSSRQQQQSRFGFVAGGTSTHLQATSVSVPNPFKKLPWNVRKEKEREMRRLKQERARLHRELGIAEDATYEEIVEATDGLIAKAGGDLKKKVMVEVAKDKILQIRLNQRLAGLQADSKEARAMSTYEVQGNDDDDRPKQPAKEWNTPKWTRGLVVKPDKAHVVAQARLWGIITAVGIAFPPAQDYLGRFTWLVCIAQLTFRGMPRSETDGGGMGMDFNSGSGGGSHRKVAFGLGFLTWVVGATLVYSLMPAWARGKRYTPTLGFAMQNLIFGVVSSYLQPYKGGK